MPLYKNGLVLFCCCLENLEMHKERTPQRRSDDRSGAKNRAATATVMAWYRMTGDRRTCGKSPKGFCLGAQRNIIIKSTNKKLLLPAGSRLHVMQDYLSLRTRNVSARSPFSLDQKNTSSKLICKRRNTRTLTHPLAGARRPIAYRT